MIGDIGIDRLTDFYRERYLLEYIAYGGSKIKFITGKKGSGKTFFLNRMMREAKNTGYKTVLLSARETWLHDFREMYLKILSQCDIMKCLKGCSDRIIEGMGYSIELPDDMKFIDYLAENQMADAITKREIRTQLKEMFLDNPLLDNNFALACSMLTGSLLGYPVLEEQNKDILLGWLYDDRTVRLQQLRGLGLSPGRITRYVARHMLRSLSEVVRMSGCTGLLVCVDDLEMLISKSSLEEIHYTKMKREDTYESIRQLIDDIDSMYNIMFIFSFHRELMDNENMGIKSYQALWMRIQNEVSGEHFNLFSDVVDLDSFAQSEYTAQDIVELSKRLYQTVNNKDYRLPNDEQAGELLRRASLGSVGVPQLILEWMQGGCQDEHTDKYGNKQ